MKNNTIESILSHPIATFIVVDVTCSGLAKIIRAIKGTPSTIEYYGNNKSDVVDVVDVVVDAVDVTE